MPCAFSRISKCASQGSATVVTSESSTAESTCQSSSRRVAEQSVHPAKGSTEARQRTMARTAKQPKEEAVPIEMDSATVDKELDPMDAWGATKRGIIVTWRTIR